MNTLTCRAVLLDIEGTVSPVTFVYDVMFPYVRSEVVSFLEQNWDDADVQAAIALLALDLGHPETTDWPGPGDHQQQKQAVVAGVLELMDRDAKVTGLKKLQGMVWRDGFESGQLVAELFPDVLPQLHNWKQKGLDLYVYSSGSVEAQELFFGHTNEGNLLYLFSGHFDTTSGSKKEAGSYQNIAERIGFPAAEICFISDVQAELDAAQKAGMVTVLRGEERPTSDHHQIEDFEGLRLTS